MGIIYPLPKLCDLGSVDRVQLLGTKSIQALQCRLSCFASYIVGIGSCDYVTLKRLRTDEHINQNASALAKIEFGNDESEKNASSHLCFPGHFFGINIYKIKSTLCMICREAVDMMLSRLDLPYRTAEDTNLIGVYGLGQQPGWERVCRVDRVCLLFT